MKGEHMCCGNTVERYLMQIEVYGVKDIREGFQVKVTP